MRGAAAPWVRITSSPRRKCPRPSSKLRKIGNRPSPATPSPKGSGGRFIRTQQLNELEEQVNISNQSLKAAQAQFAEARAALQVTRSLKYPTRHAPIHPPSHDRVSAQSPALQFASSPRRNTTTSFCRWTFLTKSTCGAACAAWSRAAAPKRKPAPRIWPMSASACTPSSLPIIFSFAASMPKSNCSMTTVQSFEKALQLTQNRFRGGIASAVDVAQAQTILETTRAQAIDVGVQRSAYPARHRGADRQACFRIFACPRCRSMRRRR